LADDGLVQVRKARLDVEREDTVKNVREYFKECFASEKPRFLKVL